MKKENSQNDDRNNEKIIVFLYFPLKPTHKNERKKCEIARWATRQIGSWLSMIITHRTLD